MNKTIQDEINNENIYIKKKIQFIEGCRGNTLNESSQAEHQSKLKPGKPGPMIHSSRLAQGRPRPPIVFSSTCPPGDKNEMMSERLHLKCYPRRRKKWGEYILSKIYVCKLNPSRKIRHLKWMLIRQPEIKSGSCYLFQNRA